ncbi:hypothetical protein RRF57_012759 [Xylaria bambusicola]|uniref:Uncharacterized protein n=1 Tax=Xylaria bambusicola TaxID=326684 RepID=A0AAN7UVR2_9PEZI
MARSGSSFSMNKIPIVKLGRTLAPSSRAGAETTSTCFPRPPFVASRRQQKSKGKKIFKYS